VLNPIGYFVEVRIWYQPAIRVRDASDHQRYLFLHVPPIKKIRLLSLLSLPVAPRCRLECRNSGSKFEERARASRAGITSGLPAILNLHCDQIVGIVAPSVKLRERMPQMRSVQRLLPAGPDVLKQSPNWWHSSHLTEQPRSTGLTT